MPFYSRPIIIIIINAKYLTRQTSDSINVRITDVESSHD